MTEVKPDARAILGEALAKKSPEDLEAYLEQACGGDRQLRLRVEAMLRADRAGGSGLDGLPSSETPTMEAPSIREGAGSEIGPYRLLERLGEGAFGVVYMAEQREPVRRKVALKILKPGMDTAQVIARFEAEQQALALMDHPHIASVFDAGATESGREPSHRWGWQQLAVASLCGGDTAGYDAACRGAFKYLSEETARWNRVTLIQILCLAPRDDCDRVLPMAEEVGGTYKDWEARFALGMAEYRCGRWREAIDVWATLTENADSVAVLAFRAMAEYRLGQIETAQQLIAESRREFDLTQTPYGFYRCLDRLALAEAEGLLRQVATGSQVEQRPSGA